MCRCCNKNNNNNDDDVVVLYCQVSPKGSLPDFYNILLERPASDPAGYDILFVDAAAKVMMTCPRTRPFAQLFCRVAEVTASSLFDSQA